MFLASLGLSLGVIFLGPAGTGEILGPMVTKLSGFCQYLGRNLMKVENLGMA